LNVLLFELRYYGLFSVGILVQVNNTNIDHI
jgi:hypothetical protein